MKNFFAISAYSVNGIASQVNRLSRSEGIVGVEVISMVHAPGHGDFRALIAVNSPMLDLSEVDDLIESIAQWYEFNA